MRKCILIASILIMGFGAKAQVNDIPLIGNKFTFGINAGLSLPIGDFAADYAPTHYGSTGTLNGAANAGFHYDIYGGFKYSKLIGIMFQYGANNNSINNSGITTDPGGVASSSGGYTSMEYLGGFYISIKFIKIKIEAKFLGGLVSCNYPTLTVKEYGLSIIEAFQNGSGFGYCGGLKIKYMMIGELLGVGLGVNYMGSAVKYPGWTDDIVGLQTLSNSSVKMSIGILQATLGLSLDI